MQVAVFGADRPFSTVVGHNVLRYFMLHHLDDEPGVCGRFDVRRILPPQLYGDSRGNLIHCELQRSEERAHVVAPSRIPATGPQMN